jgi:50S ribosomal protein L16 3-hydroxylase
VAAPDALPPRIELEWQLGQGLRLLRHPFSRMAWRKAGRGARLYVNGQEHALPARDAKRLAAATELDGKAYAALSQAARDVVIALFGEGHYRLPDDEEE